MDDESLFGSPPPSPSLRGKSPPLALPTDAHLALPGASAVTFPVITENVGSIALPGSRLCAELPVAPSAPRRRRQRSPSRPERSQPPPRRPKASSSKKSASSVPTPRPTPPPISLPDPSQPVPPNFLRNQSALLGTAGLVAGIMPSRLSKPRGSSSNPIIIEDRPKIHRPRKKVHDYPPVDPALLSSPSHPEIVSILIAEKNIFPVLRSIFKVLTGPDPAKAYPIRTGFERRTTPVDVTNNSTRSPPAKKRKFAHVPAGAEDWDVPYPFEDGLGPTHYVQKWRRDRAKQLVAQLLDLIKDAAKKAATKQYWNENGAKTGSPDPNDQAESEVPSLSTGTSAPPSLATRPPTPSEERVSISSTPTSSPPSPLLADSTSLDQLLSSLLATVPGQEDGVFDMDGIMGPASNSADYLSSITSLDSPSPSQPDMLDNWMSIFNTFSNPEDCFPVASEDHDFFTALSEDTSTFANDSLQAIVSPHSQPSTSSTSHHIVPDNNASSSYNHHHDLTTPSDAMDVDCAIPGPSYTQSRLQPSSISERDTDPFLPPLSIPAPTPSHFATSPITSTTGSSIGGPPIPGSAAHEISPALDAYVPMVLDPYGGFTPTCPLAGRAMIDVERPEGNPPESLLNKGKARLIEAPPNSLTPGTLPPTNPSGVDGLQSNQALSGPGHTRKARVTFAKQPGLNKVELLKRARERRMELIVQIEEAKIRQWELAIEGYALSHMFTQL